MTAVALSKQAHGKFRSAGAHQTSQSDDLAPAQLDICMVDDDTLRELGMVDTPVLHLKEHVPDLYALADGITV